MQRYIKRVVCDYDEDTGLIRSASPIIQMNNNGDLCKWDDVAARLRWLNADEVREPGVYVCKYPNGAYRIKHVFIGHKIGANGCRYFKVPDDGGKP